MPHKKIDQDILGSENTLDATFIRPPSENSKHVRTTDIAVVTGRKLYIEERRDVRFATQITLSRLLTTAIGCLPDTLYQRSNMNEDARCMFYFGVRHLFPSLEII